jgi:PAS domain S-box-containing protein
MPVAFRFGSWQRRRTIEFNHTATGVTHKNILGNPDTYVAGKMAPMPLLPRASRFIVIVAAITLTTITVMTFVLIWQLRAHELRHAKGESVALSNIIAEQTTRSLQSVDFALRGALDRLEQAEQLGVPLDDIAIHTMLRSRFEGLPHVKDMFIVGANGMVLSSSRGHPAQRRSAADREYFAIPRGHPEIDLYVGHPLVSRTDGEWTLAFSRRIRKLNGEFAGVIVASLDIGYLESLYDSIKLDAAGPISLFLDDGTLVVRAPRDTTVVTGSKALLPALPRVGPESLAPLAVRTEGDDSGITAYRRVSRFPIVLGIGNSDRDALESWRDTAFRIAAAAAVNILLVLVATTILLRRQRREAVLAASAHESGERLRAMVNSAMDAIVTVDDAQRIVVFNPAAERMFGYREDRARGMRLDQFLPERSRAAQRNDVGAFCGCDITAHMPCSGAEVVGLRADGTEFPLESTIAQVTVDGKKLFTAILRDVSERRHAENELCELNSQLRELASSLQTVREEERISIARELHDELGQQLLRLRMDLDWVAGRLKDMAPALHEKVTGMKQFISGTVDVLRRVTTGLRPPFFDELGLMEAARWQLDEFAQRTGIALKSTIDIDDMELDEHVAINVFRILQESLTNVARHAAATRVNVSLARTDEGLAIVVNDNGRGAVLHDKPALGHGLVGIRERTLMLGGRMEIVSAPGEGFSLRVRIPLPAPESGGEQK